LSRISPGYFLSLPDEIRRPEVGMSLKDIRLIEKKNNKTVIDLFSSNGTINQKSDIIDLTNVVATIEEPGKEPIRVFSDSGRYDKKKKELLLKGDTLVNLENGTNLNTDVLYWHGNKKIFTTDDFVVIQGNNFLLTGTGMILNSDPQNIQLKKDVSAFLF